MHCNRRPVQDSKQKDGIIISFRAVSEQVYTDHVPHDRDYQVLAYAYTRIQGTEKAMAPHSSTLAWAIPWMEEPGRLQSMGLLRVRHDWVVMSLSLFTFMHWRRKWQPTPVFLPEESQGRGSLVGCRLWGRTESDTTKATQQQQQNMRGDKRPSSVSVLCAPEFIQHLQIIKEEPE